MIGPIPAGIVQGMFPSTQMQTTSEPFQWGSGGRRMTPEQIDLERQIAESLMQSDYSPVQHWSQGLGRVFDNVSGKLRQRSLDRAEADNRAYSQNQIAQLLANPGGPLSASGPPGVGQSSAPGGNQAALMALLADPYADEGAKAVAQMQLKQQQQMAMKQFEYANREQPEVVQLAQIANNPGSPDWMKKAAQDRITAMNDPMTIIPGLPGGTYVGRQSGMASALGAPADDAPDTLPPDFFDDETAPRVSAAPQAATVMEPWQYQGFVQSMGKEAADAFLSRNGITVGGR